MRRPALAFAAVLLTSTAVAAVPPPDLADAARQLERFPATRGQGSESERLRRFFDLYWNTRMREFPDLATYLGHSGLDDRLPDRSPETIALIHRIARLQLAALSSIDRSRLTPAEQGDHDLARQHGRRSCEGQPL